MTSPLTRPTEKKWANPWRSDQYFSSDAGLCSSPNSNLEILNSKQIQDTNTPLFQTETQEPEFWSIEFGVLETVSDFVIRISNFHSFCKQEKSWDLKPYLPLNNLFPCHESLSSNRFRMRFSVSVLSFAHSGATSSAVIGSPVSR